MRIASDAVTGSSYLPRRRLVASVLLPSKSRGTRSGFFTHGLCPTSICFSIISYVLLFLLSLFCYRFAFVLSILLSCSWLCRLVVDFAAFRFVILLLILLSHFLPLLSCCRSCCLAFSFAILFSACHPAFSFATLSLLPCRFLVGY